jgi:hypothetical protein
MVLWGKTCRVPQKNLVERQYTMTCPACKEWGIPVGREDGNSWTYDMVFLYICSELYKIRYFVRVPSDLTSFRAIVPHLLMMREPGSRWVSRRWMSEPGHTLATRNISEADFVRFSTGPHGHISTHSHGAHRVKGRCITHGSLSQPLHISCSHVRHILLVVKTVRQISHLHRTFCRGSL